MIFERRGRPKRGFRQSKSVIAIAAITALSIIICLFIQDRLFIAPQIAQASEKIAGASGQRQTDLINQNEALKKKLESSKKIETSETTKTLVRYYLRKYFATQSSTAEKIFTCESNLNPNATGQNTNGTQDRGVAQINSIHKSQFEKFTGVKFEIGAHDVGLGIAFAKFLFDQQGWSPWVCSRIVN